MENNLDKNNINLCIGQYINSLKDIPLTFEFTDFYDFLYKIKRGNTGNGPYPDVSIFEAANRIMNNWKT